MDFLAANKNSILNLNVDTPNPSALNKPLPQTVEDQLKKPSEGALLINKIDPTSLHF